MFISNINTKIVKDDIVVLIKDYDVGFGLFTKGHEFKVLRECKNEYDYTAYNLIDKDDISLTIQFNFLSKKINYTESKMIKYQQEQFKKNLKLMQSKCIFRYNGIEDRREVIKCKNKPHWCLCDPNVKCNPNF